MSVNYSGSYAAPRLDLGMAFMEHDANLTDFIGMRALPLFRASKKSATFSAITRESLLQDPVAERAARGAYNRINLGAEDKTFACHEYGLESVVDDSERELYASDFDAADAQAKMLARAIRLKHEKRAAALLFNTTTWTGASLYTDWSGSAPWSTTSSDVFAHIFAAIENVRTLVGMDPDTLILNRTRWNDLRRNDKVIARFPGAERITDEMLANEMASLFGLRKILVAKGSYNSAIEGQAFSGSAVWSNLYAMVAKTADEGDSLQTPSVGRTVLWTQDSPVDVVAEMYREEQTRGDVLRVRHTVDELLLDSSFAHLLKVATA